MSSEEDSFKIIGFTPVLDTLVNRYGLIGASVYGVVLRHSKMRNGVCSASQERMAELLGVSRATVNKWIGTLCDDGYLADTTPEAKNRTHVYKVTGKAGIRQTIESYDDGVNLVDTDSFGVKQIDTGVKQIDSSVNLVDSSVKQVDTRRDSLRNNLVDEGGESPAATGNSLLEETSAWFINHPGNKGEEIAIDSLEAAIKNWIRHIKDSGKGWRVKNFKAIRERYEIEELAKAKSDKRDYSIPEHDYIEEEEEEEGEHIHGSVLTQFEIYKQNFPVSWQQALKLESVNGKVKIGVTGHSVEEAEARFGKTLERQFMQPVEFIGL